MTSYVDLGTFEKGGDGNFYTTQHYQIWMQTFSKIRNPVVAYFEDENYERLFKKIRSSQPANKTKMFKFSRDESWAFSLKSLINEIISSPSYPKFKPNTVMAEYGCMMHAKQEIMATVAKQNPFQTRYIAWLDIGLFRDLTSTSDFYITIPPEFKQHRVAFTQVGPLLNKSADEIFKNNLVFVCGCFFISEMTTMLDWTLKYKQYANHYLVLRLTNTDQQVLYAMAVDNVHILQTMQLYYTRERNLQWFYLGYLCKYDIN